MADRVLHDAYIGAGSNVGRRIVHLGLGIDGLKALGEIAAVSKVYETAPVGYLDQGDFLNLAVHLRTPLAPQDLLRALLAIERRAGRTREIRFGPRTLDLDLLLYDDLALDEPDLTVPHPRMWERAFVMVPLADLHPDRLAPTGETWAEVAARLRQKDEVHEVGRFW
ncbi:2-amino-4-hydroxy-6-hydroxymethyldihydropteridine diphosphokinase [Alicyclobacillus sendaiensis]|uniref:2-amino-4-hydroxy-6-hydroxymethyldihydropteridine diphosphokinase n=1 Tax=Alicyclobacillus sendaiensis PA2 TaxID=3029425 RepID=A0ABT6Y152_ALISE|nr:2-amino-4-hydroxy-6-hydroxymethyldihydropteridine diphosphokinase [Alicyclobacillus sendaiensis]MDI9260777.1 2-amino-4-hydroxy-6-hydroxymethyldihydropteridine diphosphokinase [Alicyclobacillus sendaiensis PA2]